MSSKKELSELEYAFKKAQLDLMLIEIEERRFRLAEEKKKASTKSLEDIFKSHPQVCDKTHRPWPPIGAPYVIPTPFTSEQKYTLDNTPRAMINCGVSE